MYDTKKKISNSQTNAIPVNVQSQYVQQTGFSLQDVTIHYNSDKPKKLLASAYTQGSEVFLGSGKEKELKHELGHVIQQKAGMVKGKYTYQHKLFNDDQQLEHDSDVRRLPVNTGYRQSAVPVIQRRVLTNDELKDHFVKLAIEKISEDGITLIVNNVNASMTTDEISNTNYVPIHIFDELINDELPNIDSKQIMEASMHLQGF